MGAWRRYPPRWPGRRAGIVLDRAFADVDLGHAGPSKSTAGPGGCGRPFAGVYGAHGPSIGASPAPGPEEQHASARFPRQRRRATRPLRSAAPSASVVFGRGREIPRWRRHAARVSGALPGGIPRMRGGGARLRPYRHRGRPPRGRPVDKAVPRGPAAVAGRRLSGGLQGHPRNCRHAHAAEQRAVRRLDRQARCGMRVGAAQGGSGRTGQDPGAGTGARATAADAQPLRHPAHGQEGRRAGPGLRSGRVWCR